MTLKAFLFLLVVTIVAVTGSALIAEMLLAPGFERGIVIAVLSGLVVFPAARWAEYRGWIEGSWSPGGQRRTERDARKALEADAARSPAQENTRQQDLQQQGTLPQGTLPQGTLPQGTLPQDTQQRDTLQHGTLQQDKGAPAGVAAGKAEEGQQPPAGQAPSALAAGDLKLPGDSR